MGLQIHALKNHKHIFFYNPFNQMVVEGAKNIILRARQRWIMDKSESDFEIEFIN